MRPLVTISLVLLTQASFGAVWFVDKDNIGVEDGTSWATAFTTIQPAIDAAFADGGGDVWIAEGTYDEIRSSLVHSPPVDTGSVLLRDGVNLFGGFDGTETMFSERDVNAHITIIDGTMSLSGQPAIHVVVGAPNASIDGLIIQGGRASDDMFAPPDQQNGAGLFNEDSSLTVKNCILRNNAAPQGFGGAIWSNPGITIDDCTFDQNSAQLSGGALSGSGDFNVSRCVFSNNISNFGAAVGRFTLSSTDVIFVDCSFIGNQGDAGGLSFFGGSLRCERCRFEANVATDPSVSASAIAVSFNDLELINCIFDSNSSSGDGGTIAASGTIGMDGSSSTTVEIINCTFWNNTAAPGGAAVHYTSVDGFIRNSIFWNNGPEQIVHLNSGTVLIMFNDIQDGFPGTGNINAEPFFVDPDNGDFRVFTGSPVIDTGTATGAPATDINGVPRPQGAGFDMGAHESDGSLPAIPAARTAALITLTALLALFAARTLVLR